MYIDLENYEVNLKKNNIQHVQTEDSLLESNLRKVCFISQDRGLAMR